MGWPPSPSPYVVRISQPLFFTNVPLLFYVMQFLDENLCICYCVRMNERVNHVIDPTKVDQPILTSAELAKIEEDPSLMETVARLLGAVNLDNLFRTMQNPEINPTARIEFQKMLNKMGRLEPDTKADVSGQGPQVVINITRAKDQDDAITIEGQPIPDDA